jgi:hypothetical protein
LRGLIEYVDFGPDANAFLKTLGCNEHPNPTLLARSILANHARYLDMQVKPQTKAKAKTNTRGTNIKTKAKTKAKTTTSGRTTRKGRANTKKSKKRKSRDDSDDDYDDEDDGEEDENEEDEENEASTEGSSADEGNGELKCAKDRIDNYEEILRYLGTVIHQIDAETQARMRREPWMCKHSLPCCGCRRVRTGERVERGTGDDPCVRGFVGGSTSCLVYGNSSDGLCMPVSAPMNDELFPFCIR